MWIAMMRGDGDDDVVTRSTNHGCSIRMPCWAGVIPRLGTGSCVLCTWPPIEANLRDDMIATHVGARGRRTRRCSQHPGCESFCVDMVLKRRTHTHSTYCTILDRAFPSIMCRPCWQRNASDSIVPRMSNAFLHHQGRKANLATHVVIKCVCYASRRRAVLSLPVCGGRRRAPSTPRCALRATFASGWRGQCCLVCDSGVRAFARP